jgi:hypothetical protein
MYEESRDTFYYIDINWDNMASAAYLAPGPSRLRRARTSGWLRGCEMGMRRCEIARRWGLRWPRTGRRRRSCGHGPPDPCPCAGEVEAGSERAAAHTPAWVRPGAEM